jgi:hypothetical protein
MSWQLKEGHEHNHIDGRTHVHKIHLFNQVTGGEHHIQLLLGASACRECKRSFPQSDLSALDPYAAINEEIALLSENHRAIMAYSQLHNIPIRVGPLATVVPEGHRISIQNSIRVLHPPRKA